MISIVLGLCQIDLEPGQRGWVLADYRNESGTMLGIFYFSENVSESKDGVALEIGKLVIQLP